MNEFLLWIVQILVAVLFVVGGWALFINLLAIREVFAQAFARLPTAFQQFSGLGTVLRLLLPDLTSVATWLKPTMRLVFLVLMPQAIFSGVICILLGFSAARRR